MGHEVETLHLSETAGDAFVDDDTFIGGGTATFLAGDGALICSRDRSGFGMLFLWPEIAFVTFLAGDGALVCSRDRSGFGILFLWFEVAGAFAAFLLEDGTLICSKGR